MITNSDHNNNIEFATYFSAVHLLNAVVLVIAGIIVENDDVIDDVIARSRRQMAARNCWADFNVSSLCSTTSTTRICPAQTNVVKHLTKDAGAECRHDMRPSVQFQALIVQHFSPLMTSQAHSNFCAGFRITEVSMLISNHFISQRSSAIDNKQKNFNTAN